MTPSPMLFYALLLVCDPSWVAGTADQVAGTGDFSLRLSEPFVVHDLDRLPSAGSYENVLENIVEPAILSEPESGGFSKIDLQRISLNADSHLWTGWRVDGFDLEDPLWNGAAALHVPYALLGELAVHERESVLHTGGASIELGTRAATGLRVEFAGVAPNMGGLFPLAVPAMNALSGSHDTERPYSPPEQRRGFVDSRLVSLVGGTEDLTYAAEITESARRFLNFRYAVPPTLPFAGTYDEPSVLADAGVRWRHGEMSGLVLGEYRFRQNLFNEDYYSQNETSRLESVGLLAGLQSGGLRFSALVKTYSVTANDLGFTREIEDPDGESLFPFQPSGHYTAASVGIDYTRGIFYFGASHRALGFEPDARDFSNPLTFGGTPYGRIDWHSENSAIFYGHDDAGVRGGWHRGGFSALYNAYFTVTYAANATGQNSLALFDAGLKAEASYRYKFLEGFVLVAKTPVALTANVAQHLDPKYFNGRESIASGEIDTFGGAFTRTGDVAPPNVYSLSFGLQANVSHWRFLLQALGKIYDKSLWLSSGDGNAQGTIANGYFYLAPGDKHYVLDNLPGPAPYYTGLQAQILGKGDTWVVDVSASAYHAIGTTGFGIGASANDLGELDWSMANPNTVKFPTGNLEGDRAYVVKSLFGGRLWQALWGYLSVRYRDGKPFALYQYGTLNGQVAETYATPKGSLFANDGPRQDAQINVDVKLEYGVPLPHAELRLSATFNNLFDLGNEMQEWSIARNIQARAALEQQIPRSLFLSAELRF